MKALYKWFAYKLPIRSKLLISFSILVMVPILVLGIYSYQQSKENADKYGCPGNLVAGANMTAFIKVADAMIAHGIV